MISTRIFDDWSRGLVRGLAFFFACLLADCAVPTVRYAHRLDFADGHCSATAVGPHTLLTAAHCIQGDIPTAVDGHKTRVVWIAQDGHDHALIGQTVAFSAWVHSYADPIQGESVHIVGNPGDERRLYQHGYIAGPSTLEGRAATLYDMQIFFGDSGAGIFDGRGRLVGVISGIHGMSSKGVMVTLAVGFPLAFTPQQRAMIR